MNVIIWHDNGVKNQEGFTVETIKNENEIQDILNKYSEAGITVYKWHIYAN
jgi:hypothetical protein